MPLDLPKTTSKRDGPLVKQFSVFLANKVGAMLDVVKLLNAHSCDVVAMSVSESTDSAIARVVVSDPAGVEKLFRQNNIAFGMCEVLVVEMREVATDLAKLLAALFMAEVNVHFTYPLLMRPRGQAALDRYPRGFSGHVARPCSLHSLKFRCGEQISKKGRGLTARLPPFTEINC